MVHCVNLIGGAGTGKTTALMDIIDKLFHEGLSAWDIGFCSFTRAARSTAVSRAADRFDLDPKQLERDGWFRTLHSICYRTLGLKSDRCLTKGKATTQWFRDNFGEEVEIDDDERSGSFQSDSKSDLEITLNLWNGCRQRLEPFERTYARAEMAGTILPDLQKSLELIDRYEQVKRLDDRSDFTDWLGQFSGSLFDPMGHRETQPRGDLPSVTAWLLDEQQDNSALMDRCFRRLVSTARWGYSCGDPFQAVYAFNGSDPSLFQKWEYQKKRVLDQSFRCPSRILNLGELCLMPCSDYWHRGIKPVGEGGEIHLGRLGDGMSELEDSDETWLLLARSNWYVRSFIPMLKSRGVPYTLNRGGSPWDAPKRNGAFYSLLMLQQDHAINEVEWSDVLALDGLPVKFRDVEMLVKGTKSSWKKRELDAEALNDLEGLYRWGATPELREIIRSGKWVEFFEFAPAFVAAIERYGKEAVFNPRVTVSTVHSAKGQEADNVIVLDAVSQIIHNAMQEQETFDEECRVAYVAVTRARKRLWIVSDPRAKYRMEIPL